MFFSPSHLAIGLALVATVRGDAYCTYSDPTSNLNCAGTANCSAGQGVVINRDTCADQWNTAQGVAPLFSGCLGEPTTTCAEPNSCRINGTFKFTCTMVNFTSDTYMVVAGAETVYSQSWPIGNCSGQPYPEMSTASVTDQCVITGTSSSTMLKKEQWLAAGVVTQTTYTSLTYNNRYCRPGSENPYGRSSNWAERFQNINANQTFMLAETDNQVTVGGVAGTCNPLFNNDTNPDTDPTPADRWTLKPSIFVSLGQPTGFNAGLYMSQSIDGDDYVVTRTYTASNGSCYSGTMYAGCSTSKSPMYVEFRNDPFPEHPGCNGTTFDQQFYVAGADGCTRTSLISPSTPNNEKQMYTSCSVSGDQITWTIDTYSDEYCKVKNAWLNGLVNFQNFPGASQQGSAGAGLVRSTVAVVTAALLATLLV